MNDISYEILDLFKTYGSTQEGIERALTIRPPSGGASCPDSCPGESSGVAGSLGVHDQVLEIGSGYGAFTGLLADRCAHVTVMDSRDENLAVNRERNRDKSNITYGLEDGESRFDWVFLIGPSSGTGQKADIRQIIGRAGKYLKDHGRLVFACENTIGLRFLAGGGYDPQEGAWMKGELEAAFLDAGLPRVEFYYPMPDHRLPVSIYSDRYLPGKGDITHMDMAYDKPRYACFHEEEIFDRLISEGDFGRFANGFLIVASADALPRKPSSQNITVPGKENSRSGPAFWRKREPAMWKRRLLGAREAGIFFPFRRNTDNSRNLTLRSVCWSRIYPGTG